MVLDGTGCYFHFQVKLCLGSSGGEYSFSSSVLFLGSSCHLLIALFCSSKRTERLVGLRGKISRPLQFRIDNHVTSPFSVKNTSLSKCTKEIPVGREHAVPNRDCTPIDTKRPDRVGATFACARQ